MKTLHEIVRIQTKKQLKNLDILQLKGNGKDKNKYEIMYEGIAEGKFLTDEDAARALYNCLPTHPAYQRFKHRFRNKVLNNLFFLESNKSLHGYSLNGYDTIYYHCTRQFDLMKILGRNGGSQSATEIGNALIRTALRYKIYDTVFLTAQLLRNQYGFRGMKKEFDYYNGLVHHYLKVLRVEAFAREVYEEIMLTFSRSPEARPELTGMIGKSLLQLRNLSRQYDSYVLDNYRYRSWISYLQMKGEHKRAVKVAELAFEDLRKKHPFCENNVLAVIALMELDSCLHLKNYRKGKAAAGWCEQLYPSGNRNLISFYEYYFLLATHTRNYKRAAMVLKKAKDHPMFPSLPAEHMEKWKIMEAYLYYIYPHKQGFRLNKFLNEVPLAAKDKRGYNIAILIIQVLFLLKQGRYEKVREKKDSLRMYCKRYLKKYTTFRSHYFMRMLLLIIKSDFRYRKIKKTGNRYLKKLSSAQLRYQGKIESLEVIPYEILWERVLKHLGQMSG